MESVVSSYFVVYLLLVVLALLLWGIYRGSKSKIMSDSEKMALTKRLLENLIPIAFSLITNAEMDFDSGSGKLKQAYVLDELYSRVPDEFKQYVTMDNLKNILESVLIDARLIWKEDNLINGSLANRKSSLRS